MRNFYYFILIVFLLSFNSNIKSQSWQAISGPWYGNISNIVSDYNNPSTLYASGSDGTWKSIDNGLTWKKISASNTSLFASGVNNTSYIIADDQKSTDGGNYWMPILYPVSISTYSDDIEINPNNSSEIYLLSHGKLRKSTDFGQTWLIIDDSAGISPIYAEKIAVSKSPSNIIYTVGDYGYGRRSTNDGKNWITLRYSRSISGSNPQITIDPTNANIVFIGRSDTLYKSINGGASWISIPFSGVDISSTTIDKANSNNIYVVHDFGLSKSINGGATWSTVFSINSFEQINALSVLTNGTILKGCTGQGILLSTDGAVTFRSVGPQQVIPYGMQFQDMDNTMILWNGYGVYKTLNGGATWNLLLAKGSSDRQGLDINPSNINNWLFANSSGLYSTNDAGKTWSTQSLEATDGASELIFSKANSNYIVAANYNNLVRTTNNGSSWKLMNSPIPGVNASHILLSPTDPNVLFAYATPFIDIVRSDNGGDNWYPFQTGITIPETGAYISDITFDPQNLNKLYFLGSGKLYSLLLPSTSWSKVYETLDYSNGYPQQLLIDPTNSMKIYSYYNGGILIGSTDGGVRWGNATSGLQDIYKTINRAFVSSTGKILLATGAGLMIGIPAVSASVDSSYTPRDFFLAQNFPNPANPLTTISFSLGKESMVSLVIYDVLGRKIKTLINEVKFSGQYSVKVDTSPLSSGVYLYCLSTQSFRDVKKFMIIK